MKNPHPQFFKFKNYKRKRRTAVKKQFNRIFLNTECDLFQKAIKELENG